MSPKQYAGALVVLAFAGVCGGFLGAWLFSGDADLEMRVGTIEAQLGSVARSGSCGTQKSMPSNRPSEPNRSESVKGNENNRAPVDGV